MSTPLDWLGIIGNLVTIGSFIADLAGGGVQASITIEDIRQTVQGELSRFFVSVLMVEITTAKDTFSRTWLDAVVNYEKGPNGPITSADVNPGGALHDTYNQIRLYSLKLHANLRILENGYRTSGGLFHSDDHVRGYYGIIHGYLLLIHMHATYAHLHRVYIDASSLEDLRLRADTTAIIAYLQDMQKAMALFDVPSGTIEARRLALISGISERYIPGGSIFPGYYIYWYTDSYNHQSSTPPERRLTTPPPAPMTSDRYGSKRQVEDHRNAYSARTSGAVHSVRQSGVWTHAGQLLTTMKSRLARQGGTVSIRTARLPQELIELNAGEVEESQGGDHGGVETHVDEARRFELIERFHAIVLGDGDDEDYYPNPEPESLDAADIEISGRGEDVWH